MNTSDPTTETPARRIPRLHVDTGFSDVPQAFQVRATDRKRSGSLPSANSPIELPRSPLLQALHQTANTTQKAAEFSKVLSLLLHNLRTRRRPLSAFDPFRNSNDQRGPSKVGAVLQAVRGAISFGKGGGLLAAARSTQRSGANEDSDDEDAQDDGTFSTDATIEHLMQLRDVLLMSDRLGWNILSSSTHTSKPANEPITNKTSFRRKQQHANRSSSNDAPHPGLSAETNLEECISLLASIVAEDCRFRISDVRLSRPPNSLQSVCIDLAQCLLLSSHSQDPGVIVEIAIAMVPAFSTFPHEMHARLLSFFEGVLRSMLEKLNSSRGSRRLSLGPPILSDIGQGASEFSSSIVNVQSPTEIAPVVAINVEHPHDDVVLSAGWLRWSPSTSPTNSSANVLSSSAPSQALRIYQLSSVIPPLLCAVLEAVDWTSPSTPLATVHRLHSLIDLITSAKPDSYLDLLEIVAYHTPPVRLQALRVLLTYWPEGVGHAFVGRSLEFLSYDADIAIRDLRNSRIISNPNPYDHQFLPWAFYPPSHHNDDPFSPEQTPRTNMPDICHVCMDVLEGFGLLCTHCTCCIHFQCYDSPRGSFLTMYPSPSDPHVQKVAVTRFSHILTKTRSQSTPTTYRDKHAFLLVNLFTLTPCMVCQEPLWGIEAQAVECSGCRQFAHSKCLTVPNLPPCRASTLSSSTLIVSWEVLQRSFRTHYSDILFSESELAKRTYEEVSISYGVLWIQLQILQNGVDGGSLIIQRTRSNSDSQPELEIQRIVKLYGQHILNEQLSKSETLEEYQKLHAIDLPSENESIVRSIMFDWSLMAYVTALIKSPRAASSAPIPHTSYLSVGNHLEDPVTDDTSHPFELVVMSHMRENLGFEFNLYADSAARYLLAHLHAMGWFRRLDHKTNLFDPSSRPSETHCVFPLPLIFDFSTSVETLVCAIEVCLQDLDISLNEIGFLWLMRRCWPNGMTSDYALQRLASLVIDWVVSEDDRLVRIAREYVANGIPLPGVRMPHEAPPWPELLTSRAGSSTSSRSGGDYLDCRKHLLHRYAARWLQALYDQDQILYATSISAQLFENVGEGYTAIPDEFLVPPGTQPQTAKGLEMADQSLRHLIKLCQASVIFSTFDTLLVRWLDSLSNLNVETRDIAISSLPRLFSRSADTSRRSVVGLDTVQGADGLGALAVDPWKVILDIAAEGASSLRRVVTWLMVLAQSCVDIPVTILSQIATLAGDFRVPCIVYTEMAEAIFCITWVQPFGKQQLIDLMSEMHEVVKGLSVQGTVHQPTLYSFVRYSLAATLILYGVDRAIVVSFGLVEETRLKVFSNAKIRNPARITSVPADVKLRHNLMTYTSGLVTEGGRDVSIAAAKFLCIICTYPSLLNEEEIRKYLASSGNELYESGWKLYDLDDASLITTRTAFLVKILGMERKPFEQILQRSFSVDTSWAVRLHAVDRLFRIILDANNPELELIGYKLSLLPVFRYFFQAMITDPREEVRLFARTHAHTLLPAHLLTITECWDEGFAVASTLERIRLLRFLHQVLPEFPSWKVLSWGTIAEAMLQKDVAEIHGRRTSGSVSSIKTSMSFPPEDVLSQLQVSLVSLVLQMLGNGISTDVYVLLKIKHHLAKVLGFSQADLAANLDGSLFVRFGHFRALPESSYPVLNGVVRALDSITPSHLPPSAMGIPGDTDTPSTCYIGAVFLDVVLSLIGSTDFQSTPYPAARSLLDALVIIIFKYDITRRSLQHLQESLITAVDAVTRIVKQDVSYDLKSGAFSVAQAFLKRWPVIVIKILGHQIFTVSDLLSELKLAIDNPLVGEGAAFLEAAFVQFASNGLFILLLKYPIVPGFFEVVAYVMRGHARFNHTQPGLALKDTILSDIFTKLMDRVDQNLSRILANLRTFVEVVHHQDFSPSLMQDATATCTSLSRVVSDPTSAPLDPNDWLETCMLIIQHNKGHSRELLIATDTFFRAALLRFDVAESTIAKILQVTSTLHRKGIEMAQKEANSHSQISNQMASTVMVLLSDSLRNKNRASPFTLDAMLRSCLQALKSTTIFSSSSAESFLQSLALDCSYYMIHGSQSTDIYGEASLSAVLAAADVIHEVMRRDPNFLYTHFSNERTGKPPPPLRSWNALALAALNTGAAIPSKNLLMNISSFSISYNYAMQSIISGSISVTPEMAILVLNNAFIATKLWIMLCRKKQMVVAEDGLDSIVRKTDGGIDAERTERTIWNEVWPPFESVLKSSLVSKGEETTPFSIGIWTSFADLVIFIHQICSPLAVEASVSHSSTLRKLLKLSRNEAANNKFNRALKCMQDPPADVTLDYLLNQAKSEFLASEKLSHALEKRKYPSGGGGRGAEKRREQRTT